MLALVVLAWLGVRPGTASDNESDSGAPSATGGGGGGQPAIGGDGELVGVGTRVQTQELVSEGGSGEWFAGTVHPVTYSHLAITPMPKVSEVGEAEWCAGTVRGLHTPHVL